MERRRCLKHGCRLALLTGTLAGLLLCLGLIVQPPEVECREVIKFTEDAGDPDMPDRADNGPVYASGLAVYLSGDARLLDLDSRETSAARPGGREPWREFVQTRRIVMHLLRVWSSTASWWFTF